MQKRKYYLAIDDYGHSVITGSLNNVKNKIIADGRYTELMIKFAHAPIKKLRIKLMEA